MHIAARVNRFRKDAEDCIDVKQIYMYPQQAKRSKAGTVVLTNARISHNIRGEMLEENDRRVLPHRIRTWRRLVFNGTRYVDMDTRKPVETARAVYMVGTKVFYC